MLVRIILEIVLFFFRILPTKVAVWSGGFFGCFLRSMVKFRRARVETQLSAAFEFDDNRVAEILHKSYRHLGLLLIEYLRMPGMNAHAYLKRINFDGLEHLDAALAKGKGVFLLSAHLGPWELAAVLLSKKGYRVSAVGKEIKGAAGECLKQMIRDENGVKSIPRRNSVKTIFNELKQGGAVAMLIDQNMTIDEGVFVDFFGYEACTTNSLAVLAERTGAPVVPVVIYRQADSVSYRMVIQPEVELESPFDDKARNSVHNTQRFTKVLEDLIREAPDQWLWIHKRWNTRPGDQPDGFAPKRPERVEEAVS